MVARSIAHSERTSSATIDRGLFLLRYVGTTSRGDAPLIHVRASYGSEHLVLLVAAPGAPPFTLTRPGAVLVIRADATVSLQITVQASASGTLDAELKIEPIDSAPAMELPVGRPPEFSAGGAPEPVPTVVNALELLAHVSRRGDVSAESGRWIAGPDAPSRIEGVAVRWPSTYGQTLEYQVMIEDAQAWSEWSRDGRFSGTRREARALTGVRFRLIGSGAHTLRASALFLGSAVIERSGPSIELRSSAGVDPLVGLLLESVTMAQPAAPLRAQDPPHIQPENRGRVRVFRAGGEHT